MTMGMGKGMKTKKTKCALQFLMPSVVFVFCVLCGVLVGWWGVFLAPRKLGYFFSFDEGRAERPWLFWVCPYNPPTHPHSIHACTSSLYLRRRPWAGRPWPLRCPSPASLSPPSAIPTEVGFFFFLPPPTHPPTHHHSATTAVHAYPEPVQRLACRSAWWPRAVLSWTSPRRSHPSQTFLLLFQHLNHTPTHPQTNQTPPPPPPPNTQAYGKP